MMRRNLVRECGKKDRSSSRIDGGMKEAERHRVSKARDLPKTENDGIDLIMISGLICNLIYRS